jgi:hypothetical protein
MHGNPWSEDDRFSSRYQWFSNRKSFGQLSQLLVFVMDGLTLFSCKAAVLTVSLYLTEQM